MEKLKQTFLIFAEILYWQNLFLNPENNLDQI